jgi:hypothetical protein
MDTLIGLLELLGWIVTILLIAAVVTYSVIKLTQVWEARRRGGAEEAGGSSPSP